MTTFKIGDKVRINEDRYRGGETATVTVINLGSDHPVGVIHEDGEEYTTYRPESLTPIERPRREITLDGETFYLVPKDEVAEAEPEQPELKMNQIWKHEDGDFYLAAQARDGVLLASLATGRSWDYDEGFGGEADEFTFVAPSLREALEKGLITAGDL